MHSNRSTPRRGRGIRTVAVAAVGLSLLAACGQGSGSDDASAYPDDAITIVVPFSAGGPTDTVTRLIADPMKKELGQDIVVKNVEGAGGTLAAGQVANDKPDGYSVLMHHIGMSTAPALYPDLAYDPLKDFKTVGLVTTVPMTIIAREDFEPNNIEELMTYVKDNADEVNLANAGVGAASHLCGLLIEKAVGVDLNEVPYDGTGPALEDLVGGQVDFMCDQTTNTTSQIKAGKVKAYAVTTPERLEALPDLQTTTEAGLTDIEVGVWHGLYVPADTPDAVVKKLTDAVATALEDQTVIDKMADLGTAPATEDEVTPDGHTALLEEQIKLWGPIIEEAGVKGS
ncbi:MAG TPA: tripartite tricarboxylate transporter substrate-binding protein [Acidimicrobiia bacterium]|nr:tripartite tricarboxylate transporter substrate-binding protein [Acidimicrobiia bacterium]